MSVAGIIVEFNPFHNGHDVHIAETRLKTGCKHVVSVMSGNFVQRGEPAICDKWRRARMALMCGVDVVIEIPVQYVISGADYFARGSVALLEKTGVVDSLCFGSESGNLAAIMAAGRVLADEPAVYKEVLKAGLAKGLSFAAAQGNALKAAFYSMEPLISGSAAEVENLLTKPNNGLAMEYCKSLKIFGSNMEIYTTHRVSGGPSATKIRRAFRNGENIEGALPKCCEDILLDSRASGEVAEIDDFSDIFRYLLCRASGDFDEMGEGLENRFRRLAGEHRKLSSLLPAVKTKRYTYTRLQREVMKTVLGVKPPQALPQYIRVLGFRKDAAGLVGEITRKASLPVITSGAAIDALLAEGGIAAEMMAKELEAGDIYRIATKAHGGHRSERGVGVIVV